VLEGVGSYTLDADDPSSFSNAIAKLRFEVEEKKVKGLSLTIFGSEQFFRKLADAEVDQRAKPTKASESSRTEVAVATGEFADSSPESSAADLAISSTSWGQFRGTGARGIADGQNPPIQWNAEENRNVAWKTPLPGLGHSCPVIWGDYVFVTSAISESDSEIRTGLYGDVTSVQDDSQHEFVTYCLDANSGTIVWQKTACTSVPRVKRHLKSTHANSTCATNGQYVVSWFGSEGVYCYTFDGELVWKKDLGLLDSGWFYDRDYQWQFGASPVIHDDRLILLCDIQDQSFIATYELSTGKEVWKTERDEIPSWTTPTVVNTPGGLQIVTNATKAARGYDFATGKQLWAIERNSEIAVPTPFSAHGLIYVSSGYRPIQPIYAIRLDAQGDLTLDEGTTQSEYVSWSQPKGGPYMPTPLVYGDYLYVCSNSGILTCHHASTGAEVYKERLPMKGNRSFVGSPVAADGHLYLTSEEGETAVIQAGPTFKLVTNNFCGENCLTTPAISQGKLFIRTQQHVFAFATQDETTTAGGQP
jgi:outer membrane protein assembly factor BamB